jgi:hypothetical protein
MSFLATVFLLEFRPDGPAAVLEYNMVAAVQHFNPYCRIAAKHIHHDRDDPVLQGSDRSGQMAS